MYVSSRLSDLPEKSAEPIAIDAGEPLPALQEFLSRHRWDRDRTRDRLRKIVRDEHAGPNSVGISDETSDIKEGDKTPGMQRQYCGAVAKTENGVVAVRLGYARGGFHCLLDGELYLPKNWSEDRDRGREAGIPDEMAHRPKWEIAREPYDRAVGNGLRSDWLTFDEGYGGKPELLRALSARGQRLVAEVLRDFMRRVEPPWAVTRPYHNHGRGRGRKTPRLANGSPPARRVDEMLGRDGFRDRPGVRWRVQSLRPPPHGVAVGDWPRRLAAEGLLRLKGPVRLA